MTFDLSLFSSKLKKYREQLKTSLDEVSAVTGISTQTLAALENAQRRPTGDEVLILADYYQCDYQFFISNEKLAPFEQTQTLYRRHGDEFSKGELASIAFAKKTHQAVLTDDRGARNLAEEVMTHHMVQTTTHLLGWLFFERFLSDSDLNLIIEQHKQYNGKLEKYFIVMYHRALDFRSKQDFGIE